ncbi:MAG: HutD family protein [Burkholderiaceae bacterium]|nr:HutD family protein [Burkholderiaceae bacterium]
MKGLRAFALSALPDEPWRNGGGRTRTIATQMRDVHSLNSDAENEPPWDWRLSVATIERSGPFSAFPGVDRSSLLLSAGQIELSAIGETTLRLQRPGDAVAYRGDPVWHAEVHRDGPPLTLLNVMTRRGSAKARLKIVRNDFSLTAPSMAVLVIDGRWRVVDASPEADLDQGLTLGADEGACGEVPTSRSTAHWRIKRLSPEGLLIAVEIDRIESSGLHA